MKNLENPKFENICFLKSVVVLGYPEYILRDFKICLKISRFLPLFHHFLHGYFLQGTWNSDRGLAQNGQI